MFSQGIFNAESSKQPDITIKLATPDQADEIAQVAIATYLDTYSSYFTGGSEYLKSIFGTNLDKIYGDEFKQAIRAQEDKHLFFAATLNGKFVGFAELYIDIPNDNGQHHEYAYLDKIFLLKEAQGKGIGTKLFEHCLEAAIKQQKNKLVLTVVEQNTKAREFYKKYDFTTLETKTSYQLDDDNTVYMYQMVCDDLKKTLEAAANKQKQTVLSPK